MKQEIQFEHKGIGSILSQNRLAVPINQREYAWEEEHVQDLLTDFANAIDNMGGSYFLGSIVLTQGEGRFPEVSDGQQRLATTTILLAAIRDYYARTGDEKRAGAIEGEFLKKTDLESTDTVPKITLNVDDNEFFCKFVLAAPGDQERLSVTPTRQSHERIVKAANLAAAHIENILAPHQKEQAKVARLNELVSFIENGATVILLKVPQHVNAYVMFETLNDRGLRASQADLLKNHLLSLAQDRKAEAQQRWAQMLTTLESIKGEDLAVSFLHHVLITKYGPTKQRDVFDIVKRSVTSKNKAVEFLDELVVGSQDYAALFNVDHKKWNAYNSSVRDHLAIINDDLQVEQIRPLMFAVARKFSAKEASTAFRMFVIWSVRFLIAGGRGGLLDRHYSMRAQDVGSGKIGTASKLAAALAEVAPSNRLFENAFADARVSQGHLARYYLRALEQARMGAPNPETLPNKDVKALNLEHILPENPDANWPSIDPDTASAFYKRIGNMVLLQADKNSMAGNSSYEDKKPFLSSSAILLTSDVPKEYPTWDPGSIRHRQAKLAKLALKTWPLDE